MSLQFLKAGTADAVSLMCISKKAFDSDVEVGARVAGGPPGIFSQGLWHFYDAAD